MAAFAPLIFAFVFFFHTTLVDSAGLRGPPRVNMQEVEASLFTELAKSFRSDTATDHIIALEAALRPMYTVAPHEADGTLHHNVVNYILHRFFVKQHGWFIRGLEPGTGISNRTGGPQSFQDLQEWVPSHVHSFLEKLQGKNGIGLRELAIIASTLDDLIHKEAVSRLHEAFGSIDLDINTPLDADKARVILEIWMMIYMVGGNFHIKGYEKVLKAHDVFVKSNKDWFQVQDWIHKLQLELFPHQRSLAFNDTVRIVEEVGRRYGRYNDNMCGKLKEELLSVESKKAGRVRLTEFYKKGLKGIFEFDEKVEYLRTLGVLDESDPKQAHVIIPNYISSRANCLSTSSFYVVCCRNECEDLMAVMEQRIGKATATPEQILDIISSLSASRATASQRVTPSQIDRLHGIASMHEGFVPLHGRLFAQWMHHVFPRECPYPHAHGMTSPQTPDEWMQQNGEKDSKASKEEIMEHINNDSCGADEPVGEEARKHHHFEENELPWDNEEELLRPMAKLGELEQANSPVHRLLSFVAPSVAMSALLFACRKALSSKSKTDLPLSFAH
mmetsp:Transcript_44001/g.68580  ORF Transcript_44001/g.68580 Transcript_44001/m.68580 type:complete len:559 (+) Transcript_44001:74-1750(+)